MARTPEEKRKYQAEWARAKRARDREADRKQRRAAYARDPEKRKASVRAYQERNREVILERKRRHYRVNPEKRRREILKTRYGLTPEAFAQMLKDQDGRCAICGDAAPLCVDHCHKTGRVRGLLCMHCNQGLGMFRDCGDFLLAAIQYLKG